MKSYLYILLLLLLSGCTKPGMDSVSNCNKAKTEPVYGCITIKDGKILEGDIQWDGSTDAYNHTEFEESEYLQALV